MKAGTWQLRQSRRRSRPLRWIVSGSFSAVLVLTWIWLLFWLSYTGWMCTLIQKHTMLPYWKRGTNIPHSIEKQINYFCCPKGFFWNEENEEERLDVFIALYCFVLFWYDITLYCIVLYCIVLKRLSWYIYMRKHSSRQSYLGSSMMTLWLTFKKCIACVCLCCV